MWYAKRFLTVLVSTMVTISVLGTEATASSSRIKDIVAVEGVRENQLLGYGLVVGLNGTGDTLRNAPYTEQSLTAMLERLGVNAKGTTMRPENVAAVMVTATLPAFARQGTRIDVAVSSMGDAEDLLGGTLIATPLLSANGEVYAVAQGSVATAGFAAAGEGASVVKGVPTNGRIANGAIVELEIEFELSDLNEVRLSLHNPDLTTARRVAEAINVNQKMAIARAIDPSTVLINRPIGYRRALVELLTDIESLTVVPDQKAKVVIDERTGVIVMGTDVRISSVAVSLASLIISIEEDPQVSQPGAFAPQGAETKVTPNTGVNVDEETTALTILPPTVTLQELVDGLIALKIEGRDMITILQALKAAGAIQAELQVM